MAVSLIARGSYCSTVNRAFAATTQRRTTTRCSNWFAISNAFWRRRRDIDSRPSAGGRHPQCDGDSAVDLGIHSDPAEERSGASQGDAGGVRHFERIPLLLSDLPLQRRLGAFPAHRRDPHGLSVDPGDAYPVGCNGAISRYHHTESWIAAALRPASSDRPLDTTGVAVRQCHQRGGLLDAVPDV